MAILAFFLKGIAGVLSILFSLVVFLVIGRVIVSWVNADPYNPIVRFVTDATEPLLAPIRRKLPLIGPGIDLSPIVLFLIIVFLRYFLIGLLEYYALQIELSLSHGPIH